MPGAWEGIRPVMMIGIPNTNLVTVNWALELRAMWFPPNIIFRGWSGLPIDVARNACVHDARQAGVKYLLFLDSDVVPSRPDWVKLLLEAQQPIISGLYWSKKGEPGMWLKGEDGKLASVKKWAAGNVFEVDAVGSGAMLIDMRVFDEIDKVCGKQKYYDWEIQDPANVGENKSEDFHFCLLAQKAGFAILVHTGVEMYHEQIIAWGAKGEVAKIHD